MLCAFLGLATPARAELREQALRNAARDFSVPEQPPQPAPASDEEIALGRMLFESKALSLGGDISCRDCHLDQFGSADGLPNAIGVGGIGAGNDRLQSGGRIVPRNTLPFWGRGSPGFTVFFWDGKVEVTDQGIRSQFGNQEPSDDPLVVAAHLPVTEFSEMLNDSPQDDASQFEQETVDAAQALYQRITASLMASPQVQEAMRGVYGLDPGQVRYTHVAQAIATFIRQEFRLRDTRFQRFLRGEESLSDSELKGGLVFFGQGRCAVCHQGAYFSDFDFHPLPFPQVGFGKNGFGVDYGRFNVTHDPDDLYAFRTPPLINVSQTAPYGHAGALPTLADAVRAHSDPLALINSQQMTPLERHEFFKRMMAAEKIRPLINFLSDEDIEAVVAFLKTLDLIKD
jgi:cytochrome c peroxidase